MDYELETKLEQVIANALECDLSIINNDSSPENTPHWDSLGMVKIIIAVEKSYNIKLSQEDLLEFDSVENISNIVKKKLRNIK